MPESKTEQSRRHLETVLSDHQDATRRARTLAEENDLHQQHRHRLERELATANDQVQQLTAQHDRLLAAPRDEEVDAAFEHFLGTYQPTAIGSGVARTRLRLPFDQAIRWMMERSKTL